MLEPRHSAERGYAHRGWLESWHSFSFADYHDDLHVGFGPLRVINEDRISPGMGFGMHSHDNMEIVTYVLAGALEHRDSLGNGSVLQPGQVQRMSAGTGVRHSEFNPSSADPTHLLQIWIEPSERDVAPSYEEKDFPDEEKRGRLCLIASHRGQRGGVSLHQEASIHAGLFDGAEQASLELDPERRVYVHLARGSLRVNGKWLQAGDALKGSGESRLQFDGGQAAEVLVFDLP